MLDIAKPPFHYGLSAHPVEVDDLAHERKKFSLCGCSGVKAVSGRVEVKVGLQEMLLETHQF